jgi:putative acetyltransferase
MPISQWDIRVDDLSSSTARELVRLHLEGKHAHSPPGSVFALDFTGLTAPEVTVWTVWSDGKIAGMGALKDLDNRTGDLKSMRTHPDFLRRGVASTLLEHIIEVARARGMARLNLATGSGARFDPALPLYRRRGFVDGDAFADYKRSGFNQFLHLAL